MDLFQAIVLGIVQGVTEPLPISSSGHLILLPWLLGWREHSLAFDVALHGGTALAIILYFLRDWVGLVGAFVAGVAERDFNKGHMRRLSLFIVVANVPAAVIGFALENTVEEAIRVPWLVAVLLMAMGLAMLWADRTSSHHRSIPELTWTDALVIGFSQALALVPGVSRSGITITTGLLRGVNRPDAARFSFLLSGPIVTGAFLYSMAKLLRTGIPAEEQLPFAVGIVAAAIVGYVAIRFLLTYIQKQSLALFTFYRLALGALVLVLFFVRGD